MSGLLVVWTTAAFGEEMLFRGIVLNCVASLAVRYGKTPNWTIGLVVSSVCFGLGHSYQGAFAELNAALAELAAKTSRSAN